GCVDAHLGGGRLGVARGRPPVRERLVSTCLPTGDPARLHRGVDRLDHDRGGPAAVEGLRPLAHDRLPHPLAVYARRARLVGSVHRGVCGHLPHRFSVCPASRAHRARGTAGWAGGPRAGWPASQSDPRSSATASSRRSAMTESAISFVGIWSVIIGVGMFLYVLLDGFDLGIGILHGFAPSEADGDLMMKSIAPVWDGNETWLVLGGVALLSAFPLAF